jgi:hypothetical protein
MLLHYCWSSAQTYGVVFAAVMSAWCAAGLTPIQRSAIDFLVMIHSERFVGLSASSLSSFVMYYRMQNGFATVTNKFVGKSFVARMCSLI